MADSRVLRLDGCHGNGMGRHHGCNTSNMAKHDAVDVAVNDEHDDERWQNAAEEVKIDHVSEVNNRHK